MAILRAGIFVLGGRKGGGALVERFDAQSDAVAQAVACVLERPFERDAAICEQFLTDAAGIGSLNARNALHTLDAGRLDDGRPYVVEEAIVGETVLARREREGFLLVRHVLAIADQVLVGLEEAHAHGLFHGTLTADKLVVTPDGCVKILDLGFGRTAARAGILARSEEHPEADLHALGKILHLLVTGHAPTGEPVGAIASEVPAAVRVAIDRALAPRVSDRWPNASTMRAALRDAYATFVRKPLGDPEKTLRFHPRSNVPDTVRLPQEPMVSVTTKTSAVEIVRTLPSAPFNGSTRSPKVGTAFGRYQVEACLGRGGMGEVYRARDPALDRVVALKVVRGRDALPDDDADRRADGIARLQREARAAAAIVHPNVVAIHEVGETDGVAFIAMEYVEGRTLRDLIALASLSVSEALRIMIEVGRALGAAHARGIVHRDVKPENIMVTSEGLVKVLDFGIARRVIDRAIEPGDAITCAGVVMGSPRYMAPEQLRGGLIDGRTDQFALGVVAYELLTGHSPWPSRSGAELLAAILERDVDPTHLSSVPRRVRGVVLRAVEKHPAARFPTMEALVEALERHLPPRASRRLLDVKNPAHPVPGFPSATPTYGRAVSIPSRSREAVRRSRNILVVLAGISVVVLAIAYATRRGAPVLPPVNPASASAAVSRDTSEPSPNPEAQRAFSAGMQALLDASLELAEAHFERATHLDTGFATAHLYAFAVDPYPADREREHYARALEHRNQLGAFDREFLTALEGNRQLPPSVAAMTAAVSRVSAKYPRNPTALVPVLRSRSYAVALRLAESVLAHDDQSALAHHVRARSLFALGRAPEARDGFDSCLSRSPSATSCLDALNFIEVLAGHCDRSLVLSRRLIAAEPSSSRAHMFLARAMYGSGATIQACREVLDRSVILGEQERHAREAAEYAFDTSVLEGSFPEAFAALDRWEASVQGSLEEDDHVDPAKLRMLLQLETGDNTGAIRTARAFLDRRAAWLQTRPIGFAMWAQAGRYLAGDMTRDELAIVRKEWLPTLGAADDSAASVWSAAFAMPVRTKEDALEALAHAPSLASVEILYAEDKPFAGRAYLLAGDPARALPFLEASGRSCDALLSPMSHTMANLHLGDVYAALGRGKDACAAFGVVLQRWGRAKSRSAAYALARLRQLSCTPN